MVVDPTKSVKTTATIATPGVRLTVTAAQCKDPEGHCLGSSRLLSGYP